MVGYHRGSGSESYVCVCRSKGRCWVVVFVSDFGNGTCLFSRSRRHARQTMQVAIQVTVESRQCVTDGNPARTTATTCIARTRALQVRIMRNLRRGVIRIMRMPGLPCVHAKQCVVLSLRIPCVGACSVPASGLFVVSEFRDPGTTKV